MSHKKLTEELHKPIVRNDLADMQLISKFNKGFRFLLCIINIYSKCAWVIPTRDKKGITIANAFQKILDESNANQIKYGLLKTAIFIIDQWNQG